MKIIHILGRFDRGGVEVFLKDLYKNADRSICDIEFLLLDTATGVFDEELQNLNAKLNKISLRKNFFSFAYSYIKLLKSGKYDVVHSHVQAFSGILLFLAYLCGVKVRVSHSHSEESFLKKNISLMRRIYLQGSMILLRRFSNLKLGCSESAGKSLFGDTNFTTLVNGIDIEKFDNKSENLRTKYYKDFNIKNNDKVIGHVGRFNVPKNHEYLLSIAEVLVKIDKRYKFVLIGDGPLWPKIQHLVVTKKLEDNVILAGSRDDVPAIINNLFDIFLLPSLYEGLPIVLLEAQVSGIPCVISNNISKEAIVFPELISVQVLEEGCLNWLHQILKISKERTSNLNYRHLFKSTKYSIQYTNLELIDMYKQVLNKRK